MVMTTEITRDECEDPKYGSHMGIGMYVVTRLGLQGLGLEEAQLAGLGRELVGDDDKLAQVVDLPLGELRTAVHGIWQKLAE